MKKLYTILLAAALGATAVSAEQTVFIGETGYDDLASAVSAATDGATITIKGNQTITSRLELGNKSLTLKGENNPVLTRTMSNIMLLVNAANENVVLNFEGLTFDGNNDDSKTTIEAKNGNNKAHIAFTDCKFTNNTDKALQTKYFTTLTNVSADGDVFVGTSIPFLQKRHVRVAKHDNICLFLFTEITKRINPSPVAKITMSVTHDNMFSIPVDG